MNSTFNYEAEASVLGIVLVEGTLFKEVTLMESHFYDIRHQIIFRAMKKVTENNGLIDIVSITTALADRAKDVGSTTYLLEMAESVASTAALAHHQQLVLAAYRNRSAKESALTFAANPSEASLEKLISQLEDLRTTGTAVTERTTYDHLLEITEEMCFPSGEPSGFPTGFASLDDMTGGLQKGELIIVAARPSVGKTAFALQLAAGHARNGGSSMVFSLEMGTKLLLERMISAEGKINSQKWRNMLFAESDYAKALDSIGVISDWKLHIYDKLHTVTDIAAAIRKQKYLHPEGRHLVVIDYLQLMSVVAKRERRDLEIGDITRTLKQLAVELNIPIILLSQLSRGVESRENKRPFMSDLRESGNIEQDADVIAFLYRDDYYRREDGDGQQMEVILAKQRNGPTGTVRMAFQKEYGCFACVEKLLLVQ